MNLYQTRAELKTKAKKLLVDKMGSAMLLHLFPFLIIAAVVVALIIGMSLLLTMHLLSLDLGLDMATADYETVYQTLYNMAYEFIYSPPILIPFGIIIVLIEIFYSVFNAGYALFYLNASCGRPCSCADAFRGYGRYFPKGFIIAGVTVLLPLLCTLPYNLCYYLTPWRVSPMWNFITMLLFVACQALSLYVEITFSQAWYMLLDFPQYGAVRLLSLSAQKMNGHKLRYLVLELSFLPWVLLSIGTMFIGLLWLMPYMNMTYALFYLDLMKPQQQGSSL